MFSCFVAAFVLTLPAITGGLQPEKIYNSQKITVVMLDFLVQFHKLLPSAANKKKITFTIFKLSDMS